VGIKERKGQTGAKIKPTEDTTPKLDYPIFCLKHLQKKYSIHDCNNDEKIGFIEKLHQLSQMKWTEIQLSGKHNSGSEKINQKSVNVPLPTFITPNINLLALRFHGKKAMVGYRSGYIFHILYLDTKFTVYNH
jgi:hypothetical protein